MNRIFKPIAASIGALALLVLAPGNARSETMEEVLDRIAASRASIRTLTADFVQRKEIDLFSSAITSRGRLIMRPPELLIWKILEPVEALFFIDGGMVGSRDPHTGAVQRWDMTRGRGTQSQYAWLLRILMGSIAELQESFHVEFAEDEDTLLRLRLVPRATASRTVPSEIRLGFESGRLYLREIVLRETTGDRSVIRLENVEVNADIHGEVPDWLQPEGER
jgi:outer membrane lipoprotein-sorting protein